MHTSARTKPLKHICIHLIELDRLCINRYKPDRTWYPRHIYTHRTELDPWTYMLTHLAELNTLYILCIHLTELDSLHISTKLVNSSDWIWLPNYKLSHLTELDLLNLYIYTFDRTWLPYTNKLNSNSNNSNTFILH